LDILSDSSFDVMPFGTSVPHRKETLNSNDAMSTLALLIHDLINESSLLRASVFPCVLNRINTPKNALATVKPGLTWR
jgi:hypothetical protein